MRGRRLGQRWLLVAAILSGVAGCNALLGLEEYDLTSAFTRDAAEHRTPSPATPPNT